MRVNGVIRACGAIVVSCFCVSGAIAADAATDSALMIHLGLMRGHLLVGMASMEAGDPAQATLHFHHPRRELYAAIETDLKARHAGFSDRLAELEAAMSGGGDVPASYRAVVGAITEAERTVDAGRRGSPRFALFVATEILATAAEEYSAVYSADQPVELEEYQDSMGFVTTAGDMIGAVADQIAGPAYDAMAADIRQLRTAWPTLQAPAAPVIDAAGVWALVDKIAAAAAEF